MKFTKLLLGFIILFVLNPASAQIVKEIPAEIEKQLTQKGEIYFVFEKGEIPVELISKMVSIDQIKENKIYAYANSKEFVQFLKLNSEFELLPHPGELLKNPRMLGDIKEITDWDFYPTYDAYVDMMYQFGEDHPEICEVFSIGYSVDGRELLMAKISDNVDERENEPQFLYTGQMHGDEIVTYIIFLRLINYLLENYGTNAEITNLVDNIEIWINPLSNPDGTYAGGNNTVTGATRYNANYVDLNRNYPDPEDGPHPDGNEWQPETVAFMQLADEQNFVMSANTHSGAELVNYPWDTWAQLAADDDWWVFVSREYADTVHAYAPAYYLRDMNDGITNGYAWYTINGGRQDFMNYFHYCREVTIEQSSVKMLPANQLPDHWDWNYRSLLNYLEQSLFGVQGIITDLEIGNPLVAKVFIDGHDIDNSFVYSDDELGNYYRLLYEGNYNITFSAPGHYPVTVENINMSKWNATIVNVQLDPGALSADFSASATNIAIGGNVNFYDDSFGNPVSWLWTFEGGEPSISTERNPENIVYSTEGSFDVTLEVTDSGGNTESITKEDFITVNAEFLMSNSNVTTCAGVFFDSGGENQNYSDNEDFTMTFYPETTGGKIKTEFLEFNVEYESNCEYDWLKIYDGVTISAALLGTYCGIDSPGTVEATNEDGALTFQFHSDYSLNAPGWKALISCSLAPTAPTADFTADTTHIVMGESIQFTDISTGGPTSWLWSFPGGTPATSTEQNPLITYQDWGLFDVSLTVENEYGSDTKIIENYIKVDSTIGIDELFQNDIKIYPNPVKSGFIFIETESKMICVSLFYRIGVKVLDKKV